MHARLIIGREIRMEDISMKQGLKFINAALFMMAVVISVTCAREAAAQTSAWDINGNGYAGKLEITVRGGAVSGRIFYDVANRWENLTNVRYSGNSISFTRPWAGNPTFQQYTGTVQGSAISGTFTDNNTPGQRFNWRATRSGGIDGTWSLDGNGYPGKLEITTRGGSFGARIFYDIANRWETMTNVRLSGNSISFTRPWAGNPTFQQYTGTVQGSTITGTFTDNNTPGQRFNWRATK